MQSLYNLSNISSYHSSFLRKRCIPFLGLNSLGYECVDTEVDKRKRKDKRKLASDLTSQKNTEQSAAEREIRFVVDKIPKKPKKAKAAEEELIVMPSLFLTLLDALSTYVDQKAHKSGGNTEKGKQLRSRDIAAMEKCNNRFAKVTEELLKFDKYYAASGRHVVLIGRFLNKSLFTSIASGVMEDSMIVEKIRDVAIEQGVKVQK
ncbi:hypothetical protein QQ045_000421 [Rhodiola kirilowii]